MLTISKTPLRISFFGGGSDLPAFTEKETGAALSATINKFVYVIINKTQRPVRFLHEDVTFGLANMRNNIVRETLKDFDIEMGLDIISLSDVHAVGAGLGGSSAFTVGLINAIEAMKRLSHTPEWLAKKACEIEIDRCDYPIGIQDQYASAFGGFRLYEYHSNPRVATTKQDFWSSYIPVTTEWNELRWKLNQRLILVYSGIPRNGNAGTMLQRQQQTMRSDKIKFELMKRIRERAYYGAALLDEGKLDKFGELLHENWMDKKTLTSDLSNSEFDNLYNLALNNGAIGGKLLGAGGGGFFLFYVPSPELANPVLNAIFEKYPESKHYPFEFYPHGSELTTV